jgi:hypothetical protein
MEELEPTWNRVLAVWWLIFWRSLVGSVVIGAIVGFIFGFVAAMLGISQTVIQQGASLLGGLVGLVWSLLVVSMALKKKYGDFRIALVRR